MGLTNLFNPLLTNFDTKPLALSVNLDIESLILPGIFETQSSVDTTKSIDFRI